MKSEKFWNRMAKNYDSQVNEDDKEALKTIDLARKYLEPGYRILDYGCASGKYALEFAPGVSEVWGLDISSEMIRMAKQNAQERGISNVKFLQGDIGDPRLKEQCFDIILAFNILHLVEDPEQTTKSIMAQLKPGGICLAILPCIGSARSLESRFIKILSKLRIIPRIHTLQSDQVEVIIRNTGFDILETCQLPGSIPNIFIAARKSQSGS